MTDVDKETLREWVQSVIDEGRGWPDRCRRPPG